jgi:hypothetical protein
MVASSQMVTDYSRLGRVMLLGMASMVVMCSSDGRDFSHEAPQSEAGAGGASEPTSNAGNTSLPGEEGGGTKHTETGDAGDAGGGGEAGAGEGGAAGERSWAGSGGEGGTGGPAFSCGQLDPAQTQPGAAQRLVNLGYLEEVVADSAYQAALKSFQNEQGLTPDGILGPATASRLTQANGC